MKALRAPCGMCRHPAPLGVGTSPAHGWRTPPQQQRTQQRRTRTPRAYERQPPPSQGANGRPGSSAAAQSTYEEAQRQQRSTYGAPPTRGAPPPPTPPPPPAPPDGGNGGLSSYTKALIAAAFVTGLGTGVYFDAEINLSPNQVASTEIIDRRTPNSEVCMAYGYSAMVFDQRVFVTYNPFNLYVTQPEVKPGCVLRRSNFNVLEREELVTSKQVEACKRRMNTFGFVGDLKADPQVSCVYHSEEAENQYLLNPDKALGGAAAAGAASAAASSSGGSAE